MVCFMCVSRMPASVLRWEPCALGRPVSPGAQRFCAQGTAPKMLRSVDNLLGLKVSTDTLPGQHTSTRPRGMATATVCPLACGSVPGEPGVACLDFGLRVPDRSCHGGESHSQAPGATRPQPWFPPAPRFRAHTASQVSTQPRSVTPAVPSLSLGGPSPACHLPSASWPWVPEMASPWPAPPACPSRGVTSSRAAVSPRPAGGRRANPRPECVSARARARRCPDARGPINQAAAACLAVPREGSLSGAPVLVARRAWAREPVHSLHPLPPWPRCAGPMSERWGLGVAVRSAVVTRQRWPPALELCDGAALLPGAPCSAAGRRPRRHSDQAPAAGSVRAHGVLGGRSCLSALPCWCPFPTGHLADDGESSTGAAHHRRGRHRARDRGRRARGQAAAGGEAPREPPLAVWCLVASRPGRGSDAASVLGGAATQHLLPAT